MSVTVFITKNSPHWHFRICPLNPELTDPEMALPFSLLLLRLTRDPALDMLSKTNEKEEKKKSRWREDEEGFEFEEEEEQTLIFGGKLERNKKTPIKKRSLYTDESYIAKSALNCHTWRNWIKTNRWDQNM